MARPVFWRHNTSTKFIARLFLPAVHPAQPGGVQVGDASDGGAATSATKDIATAAAGQRPLQHPQEGGRGGILVRAATAASSRDRGRAATDDLALAAEAAAS